MYYKAKNLYLTSLYKIVVILPFCVLIGLKLDSSQRGSHHTATKIPFMYFFSGIARPQSQFPHSCVCERFTRIVPGSVHIFPAAEQPDRSWEYINRLQTHECGNLDCGGTIPFLEYLFRIFGLGSLQCRKISCTYSLYDKAKNLSLASQYKGVVMLPFCVLIGLKLDSSQRGSPTWGAWVSPLWASPAHAVGGRDILKSRGPLHPLRRPGMRRRMRERGARNRTPPGLDNHM